MKQVIYIHTGRSSFVLKDIEIISSHFPIKEYHVDITKKWRIPFKLVCLFIELLFTSKKNVVVAQFAGFHTVPSASLKKLGLKSIIVLGGTDCVKFPSLQYGNFNRNLLGKATSFSLKHASLLLPVDCCLINRVDTYYPIKEEQTQGYLTFCNAQKTPVKVIQNGYDFTTWIRNDYQRKRNSFITIGGNLGSRFGFHLKGIDLFCQMAELNRNADFYIIGGSDISNKMQTDNLHFLPLVPNNELNELLNHYEFYVQLSVSEGFPNALCEAMLSGCIPIVSNVASMPTIIENSGFVVDRKDTALCDIVFKQATELMEDEKYKRSILASDIIKNNYPLSKRESELIKEIKGIN